MKEIKLTTGKTDKSISLSANKSFFVVEEVAAQTPAQIDLTPECRCGGKEISSCANDVVDDHFGHQSRDALLDNKINQEANRAKEAEKTLDEKIRAIGRGSVDDVLIDGESVVDGAIARIDLASRLKPIADSVSDESARAQKEEATLLKQLSKIKSSLVAEIDRATAKDDSLEKAISEAGKIDDVKVNGTSVVTDKVANVDLTDYALASDLEGVYQKKLTAGALIEILNDKISTTAEKNVIEGIKVDGDKLPLTEKIATLGKLSLKDEVAESDLNSTLLNKLNYITSVSSSFEVTDGNLDLKSVSTDLLENGAKDLILDAGGGGLVDSG